MVDLLDMKFFIGDKVVHPQHGVGVVADVEERQFESRASQMYYVISIPDTTVWVPVDLLTSGLRKLSKGDEINQCRQVLAGPPLALQADRSLLSSLSDRIKQGTVVAHCEVLRDLAAFGWHKPLFGPTAEFQRVILNVLCQEWAEVEGISLVEASHEVSGLLKKGKEAHGQ